MPREKHPSDVSDEEWQRIRLLIPPPGRGGRHRELDMREVVNAILFLLETNCGWRGLPDSFPNRSSVRHYYDRWRENGIWELIQQVLATSSE